MKVLWQQRVLWTVFTYIFCAIANYKPMLYCFLHSSTRYTLFVVYIQMAALLQYTQCIYKDTKFGTGAEYKLSDFHGSLYSGIFLRICNNGNQMAVLSL